MGLRVLACTMLVMSGCGRIWFDPVGGETGGVPGDADGDAALDGPDGPAAALGVAGDTCGDAIQVDLSSGSAVVMLDTMDAVADYPGGGCCNGIPEVVFQIRNTTSLVTIACTAGGGS